MRSRFFLRAALLTTVSLAVAASSYNVGTACTEDCDKDRCLWHEISLINTRYIIDTSQDFAQNSIDCYLEFWTDNSDDFYGDGSAGTENARYRDDGNEELPDCSGTPKDRYYYLPGNHCNTGTWDGNWVFSCFNSCEES